MKGRNEKRVYAIQELCNGCRRCEMMCSFYHEGEFNPDSSFIKVAKVEEEGVDSPYISCDSSKCAASTPECVKACPTGALVFCTLDEAVRKKQEYYEKKALQPIFRVVAPWKWPYRTWKEWPFEEKEVQNIES